MTRRFTLLSLVLFIATLGFSQQTNIVKHHLFKNGEKHFSIDAQNEQFGIDYHVLSDKKHYKASLNNLKNATISIQSIDSFINYEWDSNTSQWTINYKREFTYDANGNLTIDIFYSWDSSTNQWINSSKFEYGYFENGNLASIFYYHWDSNISQWTDMY